MALMLAANEIGRPLTTSQLRQLLPKLKLTADEGMFHFIEETCDFSEELVELIKPTIPSK